MYLFSIYSVFTSESIFPSSPRRRESTETKGDRSGRRSARAYASNGQRNPRLSFSRWLEKERQRVGERKKRATGLAVAIGRGRDFNDKQIARSVANGLSLWLNVNCAGNAISTVATLPSPLSSHPSRSSIVPSVAFVSLNERTACVPRWFKAAGN